MTNKRVLTSSWFNPLPDTHCRIGISRGTPRDIGQGYRRYPKLQPGRWFKSCQDPKEFKDRYFEEVLSQLSAKKVVADLEDIAEGRIPVLVCFERERTEGVWCHRALVSAWLHDEASVKVFELGHETKGCGWSHPLLDPILQRD